MLQQVMTAPGEIIFREIPKPEPAADDFSDVNTDEIKAALKAFRKNPSAKTLAKAQSEYDKAVKKDLMKKNTAARRKAKLHEIAKAANVKLTKKTVESKAAKEPTTKKKPAAKKTESKAKAPKK